MLDGTENTQRSIALFLDIIITSTLPPLGQGIDREQSLYQRKTGPGRRISPSCSVWYFQLHFSKFHFLKFIFRLRSKVPCGNTDYQPVIQFICHEALLLRCGSVFIIALILSEAVTFILSKVIRQFLMSGIALQLSFFQFQIRETAMVFSISSVIRLCRPPVYSVYPHRYPHQNFMSRGSRTASSLHHRFSPGGKSHRSFPFLPRALWAAVLPLELAVPESGAPEVNGICLYLRIFVMNPPCLRTFQGALQTPENHRRAPGKPPCFPVSEWVASVITL